jgi:hypothetical protein
VRIQFFERSCCINKIHRTADPPPLRRHKDAAEQRKAR